MHINDNSERVEEAIKNHLHVIFALTLQRECSAGIPNTQWAVFEIINLNKSSFKS